MDKSALALVGCFLVACSSGFQVRRNPVGGAEAQAVVLVREQLCADRPGRCNSLQQRDVVVFPCDDRCATVSFASDQGEPYDGGVKYRVDEDPEGFVCGSVVKISWKARGCQRWR